MGYIYSRMDNIDYSKGYIDYRMDYIDYRLDYIENICAEQIINQISVLLHQQNPDHKAIGSSPKSTTQKSAKEAG